MRTGSLKGGRLRRAGRPSGLEAAAAEPRTSNMYRGHPGSSGLWRRDRACLRGRGVDARGCGRIARLEGVGAAELDISASCIAEGVFTLCLFPIAVAVIP